MTLVLSEKDADGIVTLTLNDPETRAGLPAHGLTLPPDTLFVAGLHDTTTDTVTLFDEAMTPYACRC